MTQEQNNIPLFRACSGMDDVRLVSDVIKSGSYWAEGDSVRVFEEEIAKYTDIGYAATVNSGTSALHAALLALDIKGGEVIVPSFTFIATANAPLMVGARPIFADIETDTYGLDPENVQNLITNRTKAIIPVHIAGQACRIRELMEIAEDNNLILIEDCAEALGTFTGGDHVGCYGDAAILSFCGSKIISTGEGGAVISDNKKLVERVKMIRSHGRSGVGYFTSHSPPEYAMLGYNWRMSSISAALGIAQLVKIETIIKLRGDRARLMTELLNQHVPDIKTPSPVLNNRRVYQMYTIETPRRDRLRDYLAEYKISSKVYFEPVHRTRFYQESLKYKYDLCPITEALSQRVLTLPLYPDLTNDKIEYIVSKIADFMEIG
ncbi:DegT/DnrJ/EryC1/StrS family aminotransferase [Patescibacteria group bacterium]|nr:DegT/DnrJ/EryC1/StrS family aminotransferase [Patescibacteria group bacterium]